MANQPTTPSAERRLQNGTELSATRSLVESYKAVRRFSETICQPLETEDFVIQSMPDVSPMRWHLAHTTWFFETLVLSKALPNYQAYHPDFVYLFNSYYNTIGEQFPRPGRGLLSRPTVQEVFNYRAYVDRHMCNFLSDFGKTVSPDLALLLETGMNHEQQHQELALTDIKHVFSCNPLYPVYRKRDVSDGQTVTPRHWVGYEEGLRWIGHKGDGFSYDNERPRHRVFVQAFELTTRLVTNGEFIEFMDDGGYERPELWLSEGWTTIQQQGWQAPLYWEKHDDGWWNFTLSGMRPVSPAEPVCHVSYYEADAFARWAGARLPTEAEWEIASEAVALEGNFVENEIYHSVLIDNTMSDTNLSQIFGDVWEWTCSPYVAYPSYRAPEGALGEYNAKFMCNQMVLRGGSCATPRTHIRRTYRNFFPPAARWQFSGLRLAK